MISRRLLLKSGAGAVASALAAPALAQAPKKISFLTWNIIDQEPMIRSAGIVVGALGTLSLP